MVKRALTSVSVLCLAATCIPAQSTYGTLLGTVQDASGGVVPGANVTATELNTNTEKQAITDAHGDYQIPNLLPGQYEVSVLALGFKKFLDAMYYWAPARRCALMFLSKWEPLPRKFR